MAFQSQAHYSPQIPSAAVLGKEYFSMQDPRLSALEAINLKESRVAFCNSHVILLCGGRAPEKSHPDDADPPISSFRHALLTSDRHDLEFYTPENVTDWKEDGMFNNLIDLEVELAAISSLVVIILESPGAIAELGAFSQLKEFNDKLMVFLAKEFHVDSFIRLGILRHISKGNERAVRTYPWETRYPSSISDELIDDVCGDMREYLEKIPKNPTLKPSNLSHVLIVLYELAHLFVAVKENEFFNYLTTLGVSIKREELRRKLFLLVRFKILEHLNYSDSWYYVVSRSQFHRVVWAVNKGSKFDRLRISVECRQFYSDSGKDKHRLRVIRERFGAGE